MNRDALFGKANPMRYAIDLAFVLSTGLALAAGLVIVCGLVSRAIH